MHCPRRMLFTLLCLPLFAFASRAAAQASFSSLIPPDAEFAATLNVRTLVESGLLRSVVDQSGNPKLEAHLTLFKNLTGIDVWNKDLERVHIAGKLHNDESIVVAFEGRFDRQKLVDLLKLNEQFKEVPLGGSQGYEWFDKGENRLKYGLFTPGGMALIANSQAAVNGALGPKDAAAPSRLRGEWDRLESSLAPASGFWGCLAVPQDLNFERFPAAEQLEHFTVRVDLTSADVTPLLTARLANAEHARQWLDLARGGIAMLALQQDSPALAEVAGKASVEPSADGLGITARLTANRDQLLQLKDEIKARKQAQP